ncbi:MAG: hypothetical protein K2M55_02530 [Muribaculaceae bacterium]|nr:hypothetical protein [Muribaculaceae bacterium]
MKRLHTFLAAGAMLLLPSTASAQYYQIANKLTSLISPALSGSFNYKGFVDLSGTAGLGHNRANFVKISTTQGFKYSNWFFMGAGIGVNLAIANQPQWGGDYDYYRHDYSKTKCMIPVYSDFRFNIGPADNMSFFIDVRLGAAWLIGSSYLAMTDACMTSETQFYMKPAMGVRIPIAPKSKQAFNVGVSYQLLTSNNNYWRYSNSVTLNNLGLTVGFEW